VREALEIRGTMEGLAVRLAAERGVPSTALAPLRDLLARLDGVVAAAPHQETAFADYVDLNARFHRDVVALADSRLIERQLERAMTLPFASPSAFVRAQAEAPEALQILHVAQDQHRCIVEAIEAREGTRAEALMKEHSRLAQRNLALALRSQGALDRVPGSALIRLRV
jgi:GntR family transcriptional regulator of vanillate catabolism